MTEEWRDIKNFEGLYQLSNLGNVKSLDRYTITKDKKKCFRKGKNINKRVIKNGGVEVSLSKNGISKKYSFPRLIYSTFNPNFDINDYSKVIFFKDGNSENLYLDNLYCDFRESIMLNKTNLTKSKVRCITTGKEFNSIREAERFYNTKSNIFLCCIKKRKSAGKLEDGTKLVWEYMN